MVAQTMEYAKLEGNYTYVGFDVDTTGRRLIDEIVHIAAYTSDDQFSQYIMPLMNLNPGARQRHQIRVITVGFFRMLKSMETYKVIKTKTEIATIMEFLAWLEKLNGEKDGVVFVYHEQQKLAPYMMIEAMKRYNLFERFQKIVKAFVNGYEISEDEQKGKGLKYLTLWQNYKVHTELLEIETKEPEEFEGNAAVRAKLSYEILKMMSQKGEKKDLDEKETNELINMYVREKARPIDCEINELVEMEESIDRQTGMREIFLTYFSTSRYHRRRALTFRRALADAKLDKEKLQEMWDSGKREAFETLIKDLESIKEEDREEMVNIMDHHFDPEKKPFKPIVNRRENQGGRNNNNNGNGGGNNNMRRRRGMPRNMQDKENRDSRSNSRRPQRRQRNYSGKRGNNNMRGQQNDMKTGMNHQQQQQHGHQAPNQQPQGHQQQQQMVGAAH